MSAGGLSRARLERMHAVLASYVEQGAAPGIVAAVSRRGAVHVDAIGMQDVAGSVPNPPELRPDGLMRRFGSVPLMHQPGERWLYHSAFDVLGVLIARAAGEPFEDFLAERIFAPLDMKDTGFAVPPAKRERLAESSEADPASGRLVPRDDGFAVQPSASAGLFSTVDDYLTFGRMMLYGGRHGATRILARPSVEVMTTDQITAEQKAASPFSPGFWDRQGWGFGVSTLTRRDGIAAVPGRFGWDGGFGTSWSSDPHEDMVVIYVLVALTFLAALGSGLIAGVFFAFSAFVMTALGRLPPDGGIAAMQAINVAVINPWFFAAFFGTAALCLVLAVAALFRWGEPGAIFLLAGALLYLVGTILVTIRLNVPLNDALAAAEPASAEAVSLWTRYLAEWTRWNHVRTVASLAAAASFILALIK